MNAKNTFFYAFITIILLLIGVLQYDLWLSDTGLMKYQALKKSVVAQSVRVNKKSQINAQLYSEVVSLRQNSEVLESIARQNMALIKKGEIFYSVK